MKANPRPFRCFSWLSLVVPAQVHENLTRIRHVRLGFFDGLAQILDKKPPVQGRPDISKTISVGNRTLGVLQATSKFISFLSNSGVRADFPEFSPRLAPKRGLDRPPQQRLLRVWPGADDSQAWLCSGGALASSGLVIGLKPLARRTWSPSAAKTNAPERPRCMRSSEWISEPRRRRLSRPSGSSP